MAKQDFYHDVDLLRVSQLLDFRVHNVTTTQRNTLGSALGAPNEGLHVWDVTEKKQYYWDGTQWVHGVVAGGTPGGMVYVGTYSNPTTAPPNPEVGYVYLWDGGDATLTWADQTILPNAEVQNGDQIIYRGVDTWDTFQADLDPATETTSGYVRIATEPETNAATADNLAVSPKNLQSFVDARGFARTYFNNAVNATALTPLNIEHNLNLQNKDSFVISVKNSSGVEVSVSVASVDVNNTTITTSIAVTNLKVTIIGF